MGRLSQALAPLVILVSGCAATVPQEKHNAVLKELQVTRNKLRGAENARDAFQEYLQDKLPKTINRGIAIQDAHQRLALDYARKHKEYEIIKKNNRTLKLIIVRQRLEIIRILYVFYRADQYRRRQESKRLARQPGKKENPVTRDLNPQSKNRDF